MSLEQKKRLINPLERKITISRQCELLGLNRSSYYYEPEPESTYNLLLMKLMDEQYIRRPYYGSRRMRDWLGSQGHKVCRDRIRRLMRLMGIEAIYPKRRLSIKDKEHRIYPYLLRDLNIDHADHVWSTDITFVRLKRGFAYLVAVMDWYSRYVLSWELSLTMDADFCLTALNRALDRSKPEIFNTDQGSQFTSEAFTSRFEDTGIRISMDGRGRVFDNIMIERLWRTVKYEEVYLKDYENLREAWKGLEEYFKFYNNERPHQSLGSRPPVEIYTGKHCMVSVG